MSVAHALKQDSNNNNTESFARCIETSKRVRWDIEKDVIRGRKFDFSKVFLPNSLSMVDKISFLSEDEKRSLSQVQGRTYAYIFGLVERFICAKVLELGQSYYLGDQVALEALVRFSDEELKHQEMFRRLEKMAASQMPDGYVMTADPNEVAKAVLSKSTWSVLGLTLHIELFTQLHYRESIDPQNQLCPLWKDVFKYHWQEESQHAIMDTIEWSNHDMGLTAEARDAAVNDLIDLVVAVDGILQIQSKADVKYFAGMCNNRFSEEEFGQLHKQVLAAYRWQYILSGVQIPKFQQVLGSMITDAQFDRISTALATLA